VEDHVQSPVRQMIAAVVGIQLEHKVMLLLEGHMTTEQLEAHMMMAALG
jgi:hypothetical protein